MRRDNKNTKTEKRPSAWVSAIPLAVLALLLFVVIRCFGGDAINGGSQIALLSATSVCVMLSMGLYGVSWNTLEESIIDNIRASASAILILLLIGAIAGTWMVSGVVPTMICYGLKILHPSFFLVASCVICAGVSLMTGSSWTTIATIGVALMGIGNAMGFPEGWVAGAIISGAYFGDKVSLLSDTTVLASSTVGVPIFTHIRYMLRTTIPSFVIALAVFTVAGLTLAHGDATHAGSYARALHATFRITPWLLLVPLATGALRQIFRRGYGYKKAGVIFSELSDRVGTQTDLFDPVDRARHSRLMAAVDAANRQFGRGRIVVASQGLAPLKMNRGHLSKNYTTDLDDILTVKV